MGGVQIIDSYEDIISVGNLLLAWKEFVRGKRGRTDVQVFGHSLIENILTLHTELAKGSYSHGGYHAFKISDPKPRDIHKASVRDRLLHHALHRMLYPFFDRTFIADSYSCRTGKGTHKAMKRFRVFACKVSKNNTRTCWVLKCDIRKFFVSVDHTILKAILIEYIHDEHIRALLGNIIDSFDSGIPRKGLPLGNLTSQLLVNIYMNEFDQFVKQTLKEKYYIRYADDFVFLSQNRTELREIYRCIGIFLQERLALELHPRKCSITTLASGVDFLGWVHFPVHRVLRTVTKRRMLRALGEDKAKAETVQSYLGLLSHGNAHTLQERIRNGNSF